MVGLSDIAAERRGFPFAAAGRRLAGRFAGRGDALAARRFAGAAFLARVVNAGLGFAIQILLARWMGERDYGIYAYIWVWFLVLGGIGSLGLPVAAFKFIPDYTAKGDLAGLRGFLRDARRLGALPAALVSLAGLAGLWFAWPAAAGESVPAAMVALVILPLYVLTDIQTGIARAYDFLDLGLTADYLVRPLLILGLASCLALAGHPGTALSVMLLTLVATAATALAQGVLLERRLRRHVPRGPARRDIGLWADVCWPLLSVTGLTLAVGSADVILLKLFAGPETIGTYFAATKVVAIASFVTYGVANTSSHRFAAHLAANDRGALVRLARETVRWTFWPTLAIAAVLIALAHPLLRLFGPDFTDGVPIVACLALGLVAAASVGPADRALAMADHGRATAWIFAACLVANAALALVLIPILGALGAALSTSLALAGRAAMLHIVARNRLGLDMFVLSRGAAARGRDPAIREPIETAIIGLSEAEALRAEWRDLAGRALEPNVFYGPDMTLAGLRHLPEGRSGQVLVAWRRDGAGRRLVGLLPLARARGRHRNPLPVRRAVEFYGTLSTPLVDAERPGEILGAMLSGLGRAGIGGVILPFLHADGPVAEALGRVCAEMGLARVRFDAHRRPLLKRGVAGADFARTAIDPKKRRKLERQRRRLAEEGDLAFTVARDAADVMPALEAFLDLEASGWKGRLGTDLRQAPGATAFMRDVAAGLVRSGDYRVTALSLDGRPIASGLVATSGNRAFYLKIAFDEAHARLSPGILHTVDLSAHLLDESGIEETDSLALADHPLYQGIWSDRFAIASEMVSTRPGGDLMFHAAVAVERLRERAVARLKPLKAKLVARMKRGGSTPPGPSETAPEA